jgi:LPS export ABC transporter permease LptG/LPS export ABC transporter permease LptF
MKILSRYVFREILTSSILATILATFVIFLNNITPLVQLLVRSGNMPMFLELCVLGLPPVLIFSIPFGVLVGILIGLGRMSSDNELIAMRSGGVSARVVAPPVAVFASIALLASGACAVWLNPLAIRAQYKLRNKVGTSQVTVDVVPRVFQEQFTNDSTVLYVDDVDPVSGLWKRVFIADLTPPSERKTGLKEQTVGPKITLARESIAVPDQAHNRIQLDMRGVSVHEAPNHSRAPEERIVLQQTPQQQQRANAYYEMLTRQLLEFIGGHPRRSQENTDARIELHRRFALPVACLMLALVGIPIGSSSRKGGRSAGYVWAIFLAFFCYFLAYISLTSLARSGSMQVELASWLPNMTFGIAGIAMIGQMEAPGDRDLTGVIRAAVSRWYARISGRIEKERQARDTTGPVVRSAGMRFVLFQLMDVYVLSSFTFYFTLWLAAFITMTQVFNFFDLLGDIVKNQIPMSRVAVYHFFLTPLLVYQTLPVSVLLAVLVTFGVMTKNNEVTAFKACGISVRRLGIPVLLMSALLSLALFAADYGWIPRANQIQDEIHNEIKGRPAQTYLHPQRKWIIHNYRIFYTSGFDASEKMMIEPYVFELDPRTFQLVREISANRARWQPNIKQWVWEQGAARDLSGVIESRLNNFTVTTFPEITEKPDDFLIPVQQNQQMNYAELGQYIRYLQERGFDTVKLQVQYYEKFAHPMFALIMALISVPFGFLVGNRGAMAGIGVSIAIGMTYLGTEKLFEQMGYVSYLPPAVAAWAPDALFSVAGLYLILRMRS